MKRFIIMMNLLLFIVIFGGYLYYVEGFYFTFNSGATVTTSFTEPSIRTPFYVDGKKIYQSKVNNDEPFIIKGVEVDSSYGPNRGSDFIVDEDTWSQWFELIQQMGANTIKATNVLDDQFYNAFYNYNNNNDQPLYLLQGMQVTTIEMILNPRSDDKQEFYKTLQNDGKDLVDIIHGRKILLTNKHKGNGFYFNDISPWVIGYLIGDDWNQDSISYINHIFEELPEFNGTYVTATEDATNFQKMMAQLIDQILSYESKKYNQQRLVSVNSYLIMDPFQYEEHYASQLGKLNEFKIENIEPTSQMRSGLFASYAHEDIELPILQMIAEKETADYPSVNSYLELLYKTHDIPVVITSISYPSSMYVNHEQKQEEVLLRNLQQFDSIGYNGTIIRSWQDVWDRRNIATSYAVDLQQVNEWHDAVTPTQHFGLLGFKPYRDDVLMKIDGNDDDWQDVEIDFQSKEKKVLMTRDHAYLYFWIEDSHIKSNEVQYLALDLHPKLGSKTSNIIDVTFDRKIDFLIEINPNTGAMVYVQNRYQSVRQNFLEDVTGENPFEKYPAVTSHRFEPMAYLMEEARVLSEEEMDDLSTEHYRYSFQSMNPLVMADDIDAEEADLALRDGYLEIRIPYQLLNVYDPLQFTIHDDYYEKYGVEPLKITEFHLGIVSNNNENIESIRLPVDTLQSLTSVEEYLKPAYYEVKKYWNKED